MNLKNKVAAFLFILTSLILFWILYSKKDKVSISEKIRKIEREYYENPSYNFPWERDMRLLTPLALYQEIVKEGAPTPKAQRALLELYYRYPPNSRPLESYQKDLMDPISLNNEPLPLYSPELKQKLSTGNLDEDNLPKPDYEIRFWGPRHTVSQGQPFILYLEVKDRRTGQRVPIQIERARVLSDIKTGQQPLNPPQYNDRGEPPDEAPDLIYTFSWSPAGTTRLYSGELSLEVLFSVGAQRFLESQVFLSTPQAPAEFTGRFYEYLQDGSLIIEVEISVRQKGHYIIEANLFHKATDEPMHWAYFNGELGTGVKKVPLLFFGRIFHEKGKEGVFVLRHLRGYRNNINFSAEELAKIAQNPNLADTTKDPAHSAIGGISRDYETLSYRLAQFSDKFYDGLDKQMALEEAPSP